jgi:hypothetical protein
VRGRLRRTRNISGKEGEQGIIIMLVAVFLLFVVGAMAALAIDVVTLYTARSEAQLAADAAALAGARVLANSGLTSTSAGPVAAEALASAVAMQVASHNEVGGRTLNPGPPEVVITFNDGDGSFVTNPHVTVQTKRTDLPTFFARIWGNTALTVAASATAEAYNPSGMNALGKTVIPVVPACVKPWLLPNKDPSPGGTTIFDAASGQITGANLLGSTNTIVLACPGGNCSTLPTPAAWSYYPGDPASFTAPTNSLPTCSSVPVPTSYQESIAGCITTPISCQSLANLTNIDISNYPTRNAETADAVNCLTHATNNLGDTVASLGAPTIPPFQFIAGTDNPIPGVASNNVIVSDSLVTVPVFDTTGAAPGTSVTVIGFVQLFLNPDGIAAPDSPPNSGNVNTTVINIVGCGNAAAGNPILGNGASPVAVRLISP